MGMSTHIVGFKPADEKWQQMKEALEACRRADVEVPDEIDQFFNYEDPDEAGVRVEIEDTDAVSEWHDEAGSGYDIDVSKLPTDVTLVRVWNSW